MEYEGAFYLDLPPDEVWAIISRTNRFEDWWSWLRELDTLQRRDCPGRRYREDRQHQEKPSRDEMFRKDRPRS